MRHLQNVQISEAISDPARYRILASSFARAEDNESELLAAGDQRVHCALVDRCTFVKFLFAGR